MRRSYFRGRYYFWYGTGSKWNKDYTHGFRDDFCSSRGSQYELPLIKTEDDFRLYKDKAGNVEIDQPTQKFQSSPLGGTDEQNSSAKLACI